MFNARILNDRMETKPFHPFRIHLSDGQSYAVPNHDCAFVMQNDIEIGLDLNKRGFAERSVRCAILHITQIEDLKPPKSVPKP